MNPPAASVLAEFVAELDLQKVAPNVVESALTAMLDAIGASLYGERGAASQVVLADALERYGNGRATIWGSGLRSLHPAGAALVNGTRAHEYELDDYVPPAKLHPAAVLVPTVLAVAQETNPTGAELLAAFIAGYDVMVRVSLAADSAATRARGWHMTGIAGPLGAAASAARLYGLDAEGITRALGTAGSLSGGLFAFTAEGSMTKGWHAGKAAEAGVYAAGLARRGFTGPAGVLDALDGGLLRAVSDRSDESRLTKDLGVRFELEGAAIKPYPACGSIHSSIDAMLSVIDDGVRADQIDSVLISNSSNALHQCGFEFTGRGGMLEARMSLQFCVAAAAVDATVGLEQFEDSRRTDPHIADLARRVSFAVDPEIDKIYPHHYPSRLAVRLKDGREVEKYVADPTGSPYNPISHDRVLAKFRDITAQSAVNPEAVIAAMASLVDAADISGLVSSLTPRGF